jgi:hypothetical protein
MAVDVKLIAPDLIYSRSDVGNGGFWFHPGCFGAAIATGLVTGIRANFAARVSQGGFYSAYAWRMRCEIYLTTSSIATCTSIIRKLESVYDSEVRSISLLWLCQ